MPALCPYLVIGDEFMWGFNPVQSNLYRYSLLSNHCHTGIHSCPSDPNRTHTGKGLDLFFGERPARSFHNTCRSCYRWGTRWLPSIAVDHKSLWGAQSQRYRICYSEHIRLIADSSKMWRKPDTTFRYKCLLTIFISHLASCCRSLLEIHNRYDVSDEHMP